MEKDNNGGCCPLLLYNVPVVWVKSIFIVVLCMVIVPVLVFVPFPGGDLPALHDGDIIVQTHESSQTLAIMSATGSLFTHTGMVQVRDGEYYVLDSAGSVGYSPLEAWVSHGIGGKFAVYRLPALTPEEGARLFTLASSYLKAPYDPFFVFDNAALYCSELPYLLFKEVGRPIGHVQKVADLAVDNPITRQLIEARWQRHPHCQASGETFQSCYKKILKQEIITPASLARDERMEEIYSNYLGGIL